MNSRPLVYLAGPISGCKPDEIMGWRKQAQTELAKTNIIGLCPIDVQTEGVDLKSIAVLRDQMDVERCDAVLMNLTGATRVSIGTMVELGWASALNKPIILVMEKGNIHEHGFVSTLVDDLYSDLQAALKAVAIMLQVAK